MSEESVTWPELIHDAIAHSLGGVHTSIPGKIVSYLKPLQQAKVQPVVDSMPTLEDVPVLWPRGGGGFMHMPLEAGDHVLLIFCELSFAAWRLSGSPQPSDLLKRHGLYAYAIPGAAPDIQPLLSPTILQGAAFGEDGPTGTVVQVAAGKCTVGLPIAAPPLPVVTALELTTLLGILKTAISSAPTVPNDGGAAFKASLVASLSAWGSAVGSSVLQVTG